MIPSAEAAADVGADTAGGPLVVGQEQLDLLAGQLLTFAIALRSRDERRIRPTPDPLRRGCLESGNLGIVRIRQLTNMRRVEPEASASRNAPSTRLGDEV